MGQGPDGKQPHFIHFADARVFAFAGLWERWSRSESGPLDTFTILTTTPNDLIAGLHDRMPVILPPETYSEWLEPRPLDLDRFVELVAAHPAEGMEAYPVTTRVNRPANDDAACIVRQERSL